MITIRVVAPNGATLRGPMKIRLSDEQIRRRSAVLASCRTARRNVFDLDGGVSLSFKRGEVFEVDDGAERLHKDLFEDVEKVEAEAKARKAAAEEAAARKAADEAEAAKKASEEEAAARKAADEAQSGGTA